MEDNTKSGVSLSHDPMPVSATSALTVAHSHDTEAFDGIPAAPALQLGLDPKESQSVLQLGEISGEGTLFASTYTLVDKQLPHSAIGSA
ncbi:hypothetical protein J2T49_005804 [Pseudomonas nitroreducens]|nr:hypothetical protein [Pseudomonas nitroreducens]